MTWSKIVIPGAATSRDAIRYVADTTMGSMPLWTTAIPASNTSCRNFRLDISGLNAFEAQSMYFSFNNSYGYIQASTKASATWEEVGQSTISSGVNISNDGSSSTYYLWTSDQEANSFMITNSEYEIVWGFLVPGKFFLDGPDGFRGSDSVDNQHLNATLLGFGKDGHRITGDPHANVGAGVLCVTTYDMLELSSNPQTVQGKVLSGYSWLATVSSNSGGDRNWLFAQTTANDVLLHVGTALGTSSFYATGSPLTKVTDGTNWYLRTSTNLAGSHLLFETGTTEPY